MELYLHPTIRRHGVVLKNSAQGQLNLYFYLVRATAHLTDPYRAVAA
jgi:hypothetical protein